VSLPQTPDLQRIRNNSGGLPILLEEWVNLPIPTDDWINRGRSSYYDEIGSKEKIRDFIIQRRDSLSEEDRIKLNKMSVLAYPLQDLNDLAKFLGMTKATLDHLPLLFDSLIKKSIFEKKENYQWFKHELVRRYIRDSLPMQFITIYHSNAAEFYLDLEKSVNNTENVPLYIKLGCAYHLHKAGDYKEESYKRNNSLAEYTSKIGYLDIAERCYKRAIADAKYLGRLEDERACLLKMTRNVYTIWGRYEDALSNFHSLLKYYDEVNDRGNQARLLNNIAVIHERKGEYEQALELYNQSLEIARQVGDLGGMAYTLNNMGMIYGIKGEYEQALELYNQSLEIKRKMGDRDTIVNTLNNLAIIHYKKGEYEQALNLYNESLKISREMGDREGIADALDNIAIIHYQKGEYEQALNLYNESLKISREMGDRLRVANTLNRIAVAFLSKEEYEESLVNVIQAYAILEKLNLRPELQRSLDILGNIKDKLGGDDAFQRLMEKIGRKYQAQTK